MEGRARKRRREVGGQGVRRAGRRRPLIPLQRVAVGKLRAASSKAHAPRFSSVDARRCSREPNTAHSLLPPPKPLTFNSHNGRHPAAPNLPPTSATRWGAAHDQKEDCPVPRTYEAVYIFD